MDKNERRGKCWWTKMVVTEIMKWWTKIKIETVVILTETEKIVDNGHK